MLQYLTFAKKLSCLLRFIERRHVMRFLHDDYQSNFEMKQSRWNWLFYINDAIFVFDYRTRQFHFCVLTTDTTKSDKMIFQLYDVIKLIQFSDADGTFDEKKMSIRISTTLSSNLCLSFLLMSSDMRSGRWLSRLISSFVVTTTHFQTLNAQF